MISKDNKTTDYLLFHLKKQLDDGSVVQFYKAVSFFRLNRVSKESRENKRFLEIHTDIVRAMYGSKIEMVEIIANILNPNKIGLVFLYGVQAIGNTKEEATLKCMNDIACLRATFQGTHRTAHIGPVENQIILKIFEKIQKQNYTSVIKGIPSRKESAGASKNIFQSSTSTKEQIEQFLVASEDMEYSLMLIATPIDDNYLMNWLYKSLETETRWQKQRQGSSSIGMSVGIPLSISMNNSSGFSSNKKENIITNQGLNNFSNSWSNGSSNGKTDAWGRNLETSNNFSNEISIDSNIDLSTNKSYQWIDKNVNFICNLLETQNQRLQSMVNGDGGFFVDCYISTESNKNQKALSGIAQKFWPNPDSRIDAFRMEVPDRISQKILSKHMSSITPCMDIVKEPDNGGGYYFKYNSVLSSTELATYCHPPRISTGGLDNIMDNIPKFRVPANRQENEIYIGKVINGERFSYEMAKKNNGFGYLTDFKFSISNNEMHHAFFSGASRSGKSVLASRAVLETYKNTVYKNFETGKESKKRILVLDPKGEWRQMASLIPNGKFKFFSVGNPNFHPLKMNLLRVPKNVKANQYYSIVTEFFCSAYGLLDRAYAQISSVIYDLYKENDVFENSGDLEWANEKSANITLQDVYKRIEAKKNEAEAKRSNNNTEALLTYLTRLEMYNKEHSNEFIMFCNRGGDSADILLGEDDFTVIESNGLSLPSQSFFFSVLMSSIYEYALAQGPKGFYKNSYETIIVLEEASSILPSSSNDDHSGNKALERFNQIIDKSASLGLFFWTIAQKISKMPSSVIANSGLVFIGRAGDEADVKTSLSALGYDPMNDLDYKKFIPRMATGIFIVKISKTYLFEEQTPVCVKAEMLHSSIPSNEELEVYIKEHELSKKQKKHYEWWD